MPSQTLFIESKQDKTLIEILINSKFHSNQVDQASGIIIAHPYGPLGGNMHNNVVIAIQRHYLDKGYVTVCINFRGCGNSKGKSSWTGMPERQDYISAMDFLLENPKQLDFPLVNKLILCGYSFGSMIANSIEPPLNVPTSYLLISFPYSVAWALTTTKASFFKQHQTTNKVICLYGDRDQFTGSNRIKEWIKGHDNYAGSCIQGADHFWMDFEHFIIEHLMAADL